jgi:SAM-dependent methyltransferase
MMNVFKKLLGVPQVITRRARLLWLLPTRMYETYQLALDLSRQQVTGHQAMQELSRQQVTGQQAMQELSRQQVTGQQAMQELSRQHVTELQAMKAELQAMKATYATSEQVLCATNERLRELSAHVAELGAEVPELRGRVLDLKNEMTAEISFGLHDLATEQLETHPTLKKIKKISDDVTHLTTSLHTRLDTFENALIPGVRDQMHELVAVELQLRARAEANWVPHPGERYAPAKAESFDRYLARAEQDFPAPYSHWRDRLGIMMQAFLETKVGNAAHAGDVYSRIFRSFVEIYAEGRILDVGCGIFGRPYYLESYPVSLISGLDPLLPVEPPDFEFVQGISEYLPWPDSSFSTVVSATSLDHCLSLDRSLQEITRVLRPGGKCLLWIGLNPGAPKYEESGDFAAADKFHLFHFDVIWFEPMLKQKFQIVDRIQLQKTGYSHVMYFLLKIDGN